MTASFVGWCRHNDIDDENEGSQDGYGSQLPDVEPLWNDHEERVSPQAYRHQRHRTKSTAQHNSAHVRPRV